MTDEWSSAPNVFLVGAAKAGTTALAEYLAAQPGWFMPWLKEPHYLSHVGRGPGGRGTLHVIDTLDEYKKLYEPGANERFRLDASTSYLPTPGTAARIGRLAPLARVVVILRSPTDRAFSHYLNNVREGTERRSFQDAIDAEVNARSDVWTFDAYLRLGRYSQQLPEYREAFGDRLIVGCFEYMISPGFDELSRISQFLDVADPGAAGLPRANDYAAPRSALAGRVMGSGSVRALARKTVPAGWRKAARSGLVAEAAKPELDPATRAWLDDYYAEEIAATCTMMQRRFPWGP